MTSSPFSSSPQFSFTQAGASSPSPDLFDEFTYSDDMAEDFSRIDSDAVAMMNDSDTGGSKECAHYNPLRHGRMWVMFHGTVTGIHDCQCVFFSYVIHLDPHLVT